jgi:hypothetical protein
MYVVSVSTSSRRFPFTSSRSSDAVVPFCLAKRHVSQSPTNHVSRPDSRSRRSRPSHVCATMEGKSLTRCRDPHLDGLYGCKFIRAPIILYAYHPPISRPFPLCIHQSTRISICFRTCFVTSDWKGCSLSLPYHLPPAAYCTYLPRFLFFSPSIYPSSYACCPRHRTR